MAHLAVRDLDNTDKFLHDIADPFGQQLHTDAVISSVAFNLVLTVAIALLFCVIRPYNNVVYAPRAKYADSKHAPPPITKGLFSWIPPLIKTKEHDLMERVGLDAAVFMRVNRMFRNMFSVLTVLGCGILIPTVLRNKAGYATDSFPGILQPTTIKYGVQAFWAFIVVAYAFDLVIIYFLWINYRHVVRMRREYFNSPDYLRSLHARTLLVTDIPKELRSDEGIARLTDQVKATHDMPRTAIARNVKDLPELVEEHEKTVRELEEYLAKYLKNPDRLPAKRPECKPHKSDKSYGTYPAGSRVDAIEYLTGRVKELELEIQEVRRSIDKRNALSYGFASYESIPVAHGVAYAARKKGPQGTVMRLAPKPNDLIWKNLKLSKSTRRRQNFMNGIWVTLLTIVWIIPNVFIAGFLSNLSSLGDLWPAFNKSLMEYRVFWAIVQGVLAPAITTLFYFFLPAIFRRMSMNAGDTSKTSRERHVTRSLYSFFCFNNLIVFSFFSSVFSLAFAIAGKNLNGKPAPTDATGYLNYFFNGMTGVATYWLCWMMQRNLGAAVDLSQLVTLVWGSFSRRFLSPTPRRLIELSAPQAFDYAGYYNYFLFYSTVAICFAPIQPLVLPVTAFYYWMDSFMKKYLLLYVFITKYESGGMFWRSIFNRTLFLAFLGNLVIALTVGANGPIEAMWPKLAALVPLPLLIVAFKVYCMRTFDDEMHYYQKGQAIRDSEIVTGEEGLKKRKGDKVSVRFGHPVLYKPLITPMVASKSQHLLKQIYTGRTSVENPATIAGYSDVYLDNMDRRQPGKAAAAASAPAGWEVVNEHEMDFEHYKNRPEFRDEAGGDGELFGHATDMVRPGTPSSINSLPRTGTWESSYSGPGHVRSATGSRELYPRSRSESRDSDRTRVEGMEYPRGYHQTPSNLREASPGPAEFATARRPDSLFRQDSREGLVSTAAHMGHSTPAAGLAGTPDGGYGPVRYGNIPGQMQTPGSEGDEDTSYDYFRRGRQQR